METTQWGTNAKHLSEEDASHLRDGVHLRFPHFKRDHHHAIVNVNKVAAEEMSMGARIADQVAATVGSWPFIIVQSIILAVWLVLNSIAWVYRWDPYPFILLNLALSFQAAYSAPFVMMSQNRQAVKDRLTAENDYKTDMKSEEEIRHIMEHLDHQDAVILQIVQRLETQTQRIEQQERLTLQVVQRLEIQNQRAEVQHREILAWLNHLNPELVERVASEIDQLTGAEVEE